MRDGGPPCDSLVLERSFSGAYQKVRARASASVETSGYFFVPSSHPDNNISLPPEYTTKNPRLTLGPFCHNTGQRVLIDDVAAWVTP